MTIAKFLRRLVGLTFVFWFTVVCNLASPPRLAETGETSTPMEAATESPAATQTAEPSATQAALAPTVTPAVSEPAIAALEIAPGRNDYVIDVDDTPRKFLVYVPAGYDPGRPTPVVFMFHGSNQGGPLMYESTAWAAKAEQENFIVVFPTSWKYFLPDENRVADKWNVAGLFKRVEPGTELKDDVKFVKVIIETLKVTFNVD